ncbi:Hsp20/alpha crystallin family protein [Tengunoibacter tsumagoiensis]|uniref:SHSP domain-containing protein n=1 Tax=Tengunoibacter tsumagoiensis TaxID=2014871 RepID=A0A401ZYY5_9CHLR|nr:Hsp20/alpha crystallin family protein [Tengunoibacter tsumagoiensis]GCE12055.1 hypothetical protein KTT_19140 [Tengunoibacter tsumagoiensis]
MVTLTRYNPQVISLRNAMAENIIAPRGRGLGVNLYETAEGFTLQLPLPGVKAENVEITVQQEVVSLKWETQVQAPEKAYTHWNGFQSGKYQRSFTLPTPINSERVEASITDGILTVHLPKAEHAKARTIKITTTH